jgi:hypothetical protein
MSAATNTAHAVPFGEPDWDQIGDAAPQMAATLRRYLVELARSAPPAKLAATERALRQLAGRIIRVADHGISPPAITEIPQLTRAR